MDSHTRARRAAFTLIELLVVITIIAVLTGLALSVFGIVQQNGKSAQCVSNMRQIYLALTLFTQDHNNTLPARRYSGTDAQGQVVGYPEVILNYVDPGTAPKNSALAKKLYDCPSHLKHSYPSEPGYGMNWYYDSSNLAAVSDPARTILLAETYNSDGRGSRRADRDNIDGDIGKLDNKRHRGKANYVFFDGHLSSLTYEETRQPLPNSTETPIPDLWGRYRHPDDVPIPDWYASN